MPQDSPATPTPTAPPADEALQSFIDKIKETIQLSLDEKELDLVIKRRLKKLDDWDHMVERGTHGVFSFDCS